MTEPLKRCKVCGASKRWSDFHTAVSWPDGSMRYPRGECKECRRVERVQRWASTGIRERKRQASRNREYRRGPKVAKQLPIEPFRAWVLGQLESGKSIDEVAKMCGTWERRVYGWIHESTYVRLADLDAALTAADRPDLLNELYPLDEGLAA